MIFWLLYQYPYVPLYLLSSIAKFSFRFGLSICFGLESTFSYRKMNANRTFTLATQKWQNSHHKWHVSATVKHIWRRISGHPPFDFLLNRKLQVKQKKKNRTIEFTTWTWWKCSHRCETIATIQTTLMSLKRCTNTHYSIKLNDMKCNHRKFAFVSAFCMCAKWTTIKWTAEVIHWWNHLLLSNAQITFGSANVAIFFRFDLKNCAISQITLCESLDAMCANAHKSIPHARHSSNEAHTSIERIPLNAARNLRQCPVSAWMDFNTRRLFWKLFSNAEKHQQIDERKLLDN